MGRKSISDVRKRRTLAIRLTDEEFEAMDAAASAAGQIHTSTWARDALLQLASQVKTPKKPAAKKAAK